MELFRFIFSFLYTRNWHTGEMELSKPRLYVFLSMLFLIFAILVFAAMLQAPVIYQESVHV